MRRRFPRGAGNARRPRCRRSSTGVPRYRVLASVLLVVLRRRRPARPPRQSGDELWHAPQSGQGLLREPDDAAAGGGRVQEGAGPGARLRARARSTTASRCCAPARRPTGSRSCCARSSRIPSIPHTWFNLGIAYKKDSQYEKAIVAVRADGEARARRADLALQPRLPVQADGQAGRGAARVRARGGARSESGRPALPAVQRLPRRRARRGCAARAADLSGDQAPPGRRRGSRGSRLERLRRDSRPADPRDAADTAAPATLGIHRPSSGGRVRRRGAGVVALDADGDGRADLLAWSAQASRCSRTATPRSPNSGPGRPSSRPLASPPAISTTTACRTCASSPTRDRCCT